MNSDMTTGKVTPGLNTYDRFMNTAPGQQGEAGANGLRDSLHCCVGTLAASTAFGPRR